MIVIEGVVDHLPVPAGLDQLALLQRAQLVGNGGLGHLQGLCQVRDADLALIDQDAEDAQAGGVPKNLEEVRKVIKSIFIHVTVSPR